MTRLVLLGVGNAAIAVNKLAESYGTKYGTTRNESRLDRLKEMGLIPIHLTSFDALAEACRGAHVIVSFPPGEDERISGCVRDPAKIVYISSTAVYGATTGIITEESPVDLENSAARPRLAAEAVWRNRGAIILRAPALYGTQYGLHLSLKAGKYKIPGDGSRFSSRIHLDDLAAITLKALESAAPSSTYVVGDLLPTTHNEIVSWLCERMSIPLPASIPLNEAHSTQQGNRQINSAKVREELNVTLKFPTYREGFADCLSQVLFAE